MEKLNNDIYDLTSTVTDLESRYIDEESSETLALGTYGYLADIFAMLLQDSSITTGELGNELFPSRAKFEKNVIDHAIVQNIEDINAVPASISAVIGIFESDFEKYMARDKFILDKEISFGVGGEEFHLPYDIIISRSYVTNNDFVYTARYDMSRKNNLSDIINPYLNTPFVQLYDGQPMIYFYINLLQVSHSIYHTKVLTNNLIENKTFQFSFSGQLADFVVHVTDGDDEKYLTPVFDGAPLNESLEDFCYYKYLDSSHIKVRFDSISYVPRVNASIEVFIYTTNGLSGNFKYYKTIYPIISSDNYNYKNLAVSLQFASESIGGKDKKSIAELRKILPKEALSRGSITCWTDLDNYFNMLNTDTNRLIPLKRVDNQFERSYYAHMLLKDSYDNVIPTNTIPLQIRESCFDTHDNRKYVLKPGCYITYDGTIGTVEVYDETNKNRLDSITANDKDQFLYTTPFMVVVTGDPLTVSYYMPIINESRFLDFTYINTDSVLQFISTNINWNRYFLTEPDTYTMNISITQNISYNKNLVTLNEDGEIVSTKIKIVLVYYNSDDSVVPYAYSFANIINYDTQDAYTYTFTAKLKTNDALNDKNKMYISGTKKAYTTADFNGCFSANIGCKMYVLVELDEGEFGRYDIDAIVPGLEGYTVCNMYTIDGGIDLYINYSEIVSSQATDIKIETDYDIENGFNLTSVPCIRRSYIETEENMLSFIDNLDYKKAYIENALDVLENNFKIDFKFFNTYGPSKIYTLDRAGTKVINRVNLTLNFEIKLIQNSDKSTKEYILKDIKSIIEDLNDISSLHIPNLITTITNKYKDNIEYIEFLGFNDYGPGVQHLYRQDIKNEVITVPEFLTVHTNLDMSPDINIRLA